jgi:L-fuculose-phosphate aldolase
MNDDSAPSLRERLLDSCRSLLGQNVLVGASGNVSVRCGEGFLVTPSALPYDRCAPEDMAWTGLDGAFAGRRRPSSEWRMHRDIYRAKPEVAAIVHAHAPNATALACLGRALPAFHYEVVFFGGDDIPCCAFHEPGSQELSDAALECLKERRACLMANHGFTVIGKSLGDAEYLAVELEHLAGIYLKAASVGEPRLLTPQQFALAANIMRTYNENRAAGGE